MNPFHTLTVGRPVTRMLGSRVPMIVTVTKVTEATIECAPWVFNRDTGMEIDHEMGWDGLNTTGSTLRIGGPVKAAPKVKAPAPVEVAAAPAPLPDLFTEAAP